VRKKLERVLSSPDLFTLDFVDTCAAPTTGPSLYHRPAVTTHQGRVCARARAEERPTPHHRAFAIPCLLSLCSPRPRRDSSGRRSRGGRPWPPTGRSHHAARRPGGVGKRTSSEWNRRSRSTVDAPQQQHCDHGGCRGGQLGSDAGTQIRIRPRDGRGLAQAGWQAARGESASERKKDFGGGSRWTLARVPQPRALSTPPLPTTRALPGSVATMISCPGGRSVEDKAAGG
jgi:hypothetical protein